MKQTLSKVFAMDLHDFIVSDDFDCHVCIAPGLISSADDITEYTLTGESRYYVTVIQNLSDADAIVALGIVPIVSQCGIIFGIFIGNDRIWTL